MIPQSIETAPKDGSEILVFFKTIGWKSVIWVGDEDGSWCVNDGKHGPFPVRGYPPSGATHWIPLPKDETVRLLPDQTDTTYCQSLINQAKTVYCQSLINQNKTTDHPNRKIEWLLWQLALTLEETLEELNTLKSNENPKIPTATNPTELY